MPRPPYRRWPTRRRRPRANASEMMERASREAVAVLWRALAEAESVLTGLGQPPADRRRPPRDLPPDLQEAVRSVADYFGRVVDLIGEERRLLSEQVAALGQAVERLEGQLSGLAEVLGQAPKPGEAPAPAPETAPEAPEEEVEPLFAAGGEGVQLVIAPVAGFQHLMDLQRALNSIPAIEGASVEGYLDGEARLVLHLREAVTASRIADGVRQATGGPVNVEETRPEALRLRLRLGDTS